MTAIQSFLAAIGAAVLGLCASVGALSIFTASAVSHVFRPPWYPAEIGRQLLRIGYFSLPVVGLTAFFTGAALALQIYTGGARFNAEAVVPSIVAIGMVRELGPVLGGLMVAGRVSASIAAELGTMRVTEQIDALTTLSTNPMKYLVAPRLIAATLAMPAKRNDPGHPLRRRQARRDCRPYRAASQQLAQLACHQTVSRRTCDAVVHHRHGVCGAGLLDDPAVYGG